MTTLTVPHLAVNSVDRDMGCVRVYALSVPALARGTGRGRSEPARTDRLPPADRGGGVASRQMGTNAHLDNGAQLCNAAFANDRIHISMT